MDGGTDERTDGRTERRTDGRRARGPHRRRLREAATCRLGDHRGTEHRASLSTDGYRASEPTRALSLSSSRTCLGPSDSGAPPPLPLPLSSSLARAFPNRPFFSLPPSSYPARGREGGRRGGNVRVLHVVGMHAVRAFFPRATGARVEEGAKGRTRRCVRLIGSRTNLSCAPPRRRVARNREESRGTSSTRRRGAARCVKNLSKLTSSRTREA